VVLGSQAATDGRAFLGLDASGRLAAGIGAQGTAVIRDLEADRRNLLTRTEDFSNAIWTKGGVTATSNKITAVAINTNHVVIQAFSHVSGVTYTYQQKLKYDNNRFVSLRIFAGVAPHASFDLIDGVIAGVQSGASATIEDIGNGEYICTITVTATSTGTGNVSIWLQPSATNYGATWLANGTEAVFGRDAQLEEGPTATEYQPILGAALNDIRNAWHTGAVTWDGTTVKLYLDGAEVYSAAQDGAVNTTVDMFKGALNANGTAAGFWQGRIEHAIALDRVLTPAEITNITTFWSA
jgi:hypothetical protein